MSKVNKAPGAKRMSKTELAGIIKNPESGILVITHTKNDGTIKTGTYRQHPVEKVDQPAPDVSKKKPNELGYHPMWDVKKRSWSTINLQKVTEVEAGDGSFKLNS